MIIIVPIIVTTPVNKLVKLCNNPFPIKSISLITRPIISPWGWLSIYFKGNKWSFSKTLSRTSLVILYVILFVNWPKSHWTNTQTTITPTIIINCTINALKSTWLIPINESIALPNNTGVNNVKQTLKNDKTKITIIISWYGLQ